MDESKKREPRLTLPETGDVAAVHEHEQQGSTAIVGFGGNVAKTWAEARTKQLADRSHGGGHPNS